MTTVQLVGVRGQTAVVQKDTEPPVELTWGLLHEAQHQEDVLGYVYRWLMNEFCRCEYEQRNGRPWQSPRRTVEEIAAAMKAQDEREKAETRALLLKRARQQEAEARASLELAELRRVEAERRETPTNSPWEPIPSWQVPDGIRFDTLARDQGQIVEYSYGIFGATEAGSCDPYMRIIDHSDGSYMFYKRRG